MKYSLGKTKAALAFCTDDEGLLIDKVLGAVLVRWSKELYHLLVEHYRLRKSKRRIAEELYEKHQTGAL